MKAYLFTIVRRLYLAEVHRTARRSELTDDMPSASPDQHRQLEYGTTLRVVLGALKQLPEVERAALLMRVQDAMPYEQIAQVLDISTANAKVKVHRARLKLAAVIPGAES